MERPRAAPTKTLPSPLAEPQSTSDDHRQAGGLPESLKGAVAAFAAAAGIPADRLYGHLLSALSTTHRPSLSLVSNHTAASDATLVNRHRLRKIVEAFAARDSTAARSPKVADGRVSRVAVLLQVGRVADVVLADLHCVSASSGGVGSLIDALVWVAEVEQGLQGAAQSVSGVSEEPRGYPVSAGLGPEVIVEEIDKCLSTLSQDSSKGDTVQTKAASNIRTGDNGDGQQKDQLACRLRRHLLGRLVALRNRNQELQTRITALEDQNEVRKREIRTSFASLQSTEDRYQKLAKEWKIKEKEYLKKWFKTADMNQFVRAKIQLNSVGSSKTSKNDPPADGSSTNTIEKLSKELKVLMARTKRVCQFCRQTIKKNLESTELQTSCIQNGLELLTKTDLFSNLPNKPIKENPASESNLIPLDVLQATTWRQSIIKAMPPLPSIPPLPSDTLQLVLDWLVKHRRRFEHLKELRQRDAELEGKVLAFSHILRS